MALKPMRAFMVHTVQLLGTSLRIPAGTLVEATPATNQPVRDHYFVRPHRGCWEDGVIRNPEDTILVSLTDLDFRRITLPLYAVTWGSRRCLRVGSSSAPTVYEAEARKIAEAKARYYAQVTIRRAESVGRRAGRYEIHAVIK